MVLNGQLLLATGFEDGAGNCVGMDGSVSFAGMVVTIDAANALHGSFGLNVKKVAGGASAYGGALYSLPPHIGEQGLIKPSSLAMCVAVKVVTRPSANDVCLICFAPAGINSGINTNPFGLWMKSNGALWIGDGGGGVTPGTPIQRYYQVLVYGDGDSSGVGATLLHTSKVFGALLGSNVIYQDVGYTLATATIYRLHLITWPARRVTTAADEWENAGCGVGLLNRGSIDTNTEVIFDDWVVVGGGRPAPPSPVIKEYRVPTAVGTYNTWTSSVPGNKWADIDERPPNTADYIYKAASTTGKQSFTTGAHPTHGTTPSGANVIGVQVYGRGNANGATGGTYRWLQRLSGGEPLGTLHQPGIGNPNANAPYPQVRSHDPIGNAWTPANVDAVEFGVDKNISGDTQMNIEDLIMEVCIGTDSVGDLYTRPSAVMVV